MRVFSVVGAIGFLLAAPSAHAQVSGRVTSLQIGSDVLFGQEFSLNFCQPTMGADAQCLSDPGTKASSCRFRNDGQPTSHTCDSGSVVDCGQPHFLRKWIMNNMWPPLFPPNPFIYYAPRYRLDFANGWITEVNWVSCAANNVHQQTAWRYFNSFPQWTSPAEAAIQGFADHIRPAFARGTIVADVVSDGTQSPKMTLVLEQFVGGAWSAVSQVTSTDIGSPAAYEVSGYVEPSVDVRVRIEFLSFDARLHDARLFVEQCIPDVSRPGQCLGDP